MKKGKNRTFAHTPARAAEARPIPPAGAPANRKRTVAISIGAIGLTAVALVGIANWQNSCPEPDPSKPGAQPQNCRSSGRWSSSLHHGSGSSGSRVHETHTAVQRGGFGRTGSSFFGGGG